MFTRVAGTRVCDHPGDGTKCQGVSVGRYGGANVCADTQRDALCDEMSVDFFSTQISPGVETVGGDIRLIQTP